MFCVAGTQVNQLVSRLAMFAQAFHRRMERATAEVCQKKLHDLEELLTNRLSKDQPSWSAILLTVSRAP